MTGSKCRRLKAFASMIIDAALACVFSFSSNALANYDDWTRKWDDFAEMIETLRLIELNIHEADKNIVK